MFDDIIRIYDSLEPAWTDAWSPLKSEIEFWHRMRLFAAMRWCLNQMTMPISNLRVLDVGCGVGHSTRTLIEFGIKPENVLGIDLRPTAIEYARSLNPAIQFEVVRDFGDWPNPESFDLCMQCTVFSSLEGIERRLLLADKMVDMTQHNGFIFWWDLIYANNFAGSDILVPEEYFHNAIMINKTPVSLKPTLMESIIYRSTLSTKFLSMVQDFVGYKKTHIMALFQKS